MTASPRIRIAGERRRGNVEGGRRIEGAVYSCAGRIGLVGVGETTEDISFPVTYLNEPTFNYGSALGENQSITAGEIPYAVGMVRRWEVKPRPDDPFNPLYIGANLIIIVFGPEDATDLVTIFHWRMEGPALVNPVQGMAPP